jgi:hypothetical protein
MHRKKYFPTAGWEKITDGPGMMDFTESPT